MPGKQSMKLGCVATIPCVDLPGYVAIKDLIMLGSKDARYKALRKENPVLKKYLSSFRTMFDDRVNPTIIARDVSLPKVDAGYLCAFRNVVAVSAVLNSRPRKQACGIFCTDVFDFCPVNVSSDGTDLVGKTPFEISVWSNVNQFGGQMSQSVIHPESLQCMSDDELMKALLDLVEYSPMQKCERAFRTRVMRSLGLAFHALRSPFANMGEPVDFGVQMALWISAFETLANPHTSDVRFRDVRAMIEAVIWQQERLQRKTRVIRYGKKNKKEMVTLPVQVYWRAYRTRNAYLHGNAFRPSEYEHKARKGWGSLFVQVPALYRCVLITALCKNGFGPLRRNRFDQKMYEQALR